MFDLCWHASSVFGHQAVVRSGTSLSDVRCVYRAALCKDNPECYWRGLLALKASCSVPVNIKRVSIQDLKGLHSVGHADCEGKHISVYSWTLIGSFQRKCSCLKSTNQSAGLQKSTFEKNAWKSTLRLFFKIQEICFLATTTTTTTTTTCRRSWTPFSKSPALFWN